MPDLAQTIARYREHANGYDESARRTMWVRERTIDRLDLRPGDRVLDVACGTGLSLEALSRAVGSTGEVVGVEVSPEMMTIARQRVRDAGWDNVHLLRSPVETAAIAGDFDAVLFHFTHDVMRSPQALDRIFSAVGRGARVAFAGMKYAPRWMAPVNLIVRAKARPYMTTFDGLDTPWDLALPYLAEFSWYPVLFGTGYVGWGRARGGDASRPIRQGHAAGRSADPGAIPLVG
jgi:demethylmenaquinone methyltransferase/2-methoxy-6-polyprenyl-1,4-benzoquinol methylase